MTASKRLEADATRLRAHLAQLLAEEGQLADPAWRKAVETVPRHRFVPGFYLDADERTQEGLTIWQPVTAERDYDRWLAAAYSDITLITQFDGEEPDWQHPAERYGGAPTSSSTLPSLVVRMWEDADLAQGHRVLEIGTGTGYSTALACERLGSDAVTSIEVDSHRLNQAAATLYSLGHVPDLAVADGLYGYWPCAPYDRIVAACSFRSVPPALIAQTRLGGKILLTLSGWLYGYARALLTVSDAGTAEGVLLPGTVSFMSARAHAAPAFGNPAHWGNALTERGRTARHSPQLINAASEEAFHLRFLAQCAIPNAQMITIDDTTHLIDVVSGSAASLTPNDDGWQVRQHGPLLLWDAVEDAIDTWQNAGRPDQTGFGLTVTGDGQRVWLGDPRGPNWSLPA
ncbi:ATP-grasp peptide maturase system methyltransferase [Nonomuraea sp. NPDC049269]|uniref:ATP-grasp peptide maturase system methyltransferase n=1 Tax=Nonomuraea sp. NPDC049269 TaxID=3364349 RepID=UPI00371C7950